VRTTPIGGDSDPNGLRLDLIEAGTFDDGVVLHRHEP
jgi:hypothetical protein